MMRTYGKKAAFLTIFGDIAKGIVAVAIGAFAMGVTLGGYLAGLFCMLGHIFPVFYGFKGGKGVATSVGIILMLNPFVIGVMLCVFVITVAISKYISLGSVLAAAIFPLLTYSSLFGTSGQIAHKGFAFIFSFIMGIIFGGLSSSFLKKMKIYHLNRVQEISILLLFAFMCYTLCDWIHLSPIISLLSCGIFMSHYTFYNLCYQSREESTSISRILEILASAFAFSFLGLTTVYFTTQALSIGFVIFELFATIIGRFCAVFVQLWIFKLFCIDDFKLKTSKKIVLTLTGTIKGAVSFALALSIHSSNEKNREVLISSMIIIVLITTVVFGGIMPYLKRSVKAIDYNSPQGSPESSSYVQGEHSINEEESLYTYIHPNFKGDNKNKMEKKSLDELKTQVSYWLSHYWVEFDDVCIKPKLVHNWPEVKEDNDNITKLIKLALHKYKVKKLPTTIETDSLLLKTPEIGRRSGGNSIEMNLMSSSQIRLDKSIKEDNDKKIELPELNEKLLFHSESEKSHDNK
jgi:acyl-phosphate glycerol 3-phosphate acyltransferase